MLIPYKIYSNASQTGRKYTRSELARVHVRLIIDVLDIFNHALRYHSQAEPGLGDADLAPAGD